MTKKGYLGITALIVFVIAVGGFIYWQLASVEQPKEQADQDANRLEETHKPEQPSEANKPPRKARAGFKWEWHGDHWHEMPIAQAPQQTPPVQVQPPAKPAYTGPLTFHKELLETNPVKALRLQSKERGHWSAEHIPPFPADDTEAQEYARSLYLLNYYVGIGMADTSEYQKVARAYLSQKRAIRAQFPANSITAREMDLWRITWTHTAAGKITPYGGMTRYGRARMFDSDYFPPFIDVPEDAPDFIKDYVKGFIKDVPK